MFLDEVREGKLHMKGNIVRIGPKTKGYGFILGEDGDDYFLHISKLCGCIWEELAEGDEVFLNHYKGIIL